MCHPVCLRVLLHACLPTCLPVCLLALPHACLVPTCLPARSPARLPTCAPACLSAGIAAGNLLLFRKPAYMIIIIIQKMFCYQAYDGVSEFQSRSKVHTIIQPPRNNPLHSAANDISAADARSQCVNSILFIAFSGSRLIHFLLFAS